MQMTTTKLFPFYAVIFLAFLGYSMMITVFTPMMIYASHGSLEERLFWLGVLLGLYSIGQIFGTPLILRLSNRFGPKMMYLLSLGFTAMGYAWIAISLDRSNLITLGLSIFLTGFSESNVAMADQAVIGSALHIRRTQWISYIETSKSSAFFIGPILGSLSSKMRLSLPFWAVFFFLVMAIAWLIFLLPNTKPQKTQSSLLMTLRQRPLRPFLVNFLAYFAIFGFFRAYPMDLVDRFQFDVVTLSLYIMWVAVPMILVTAWLNKYFLRFFAPKKLAIMGTFFSGFFMIFLPFIHSAGYLMLADLFLVGLGIGFCLPNAPLLISNGLRSNEREQAIEVDETFQLGSEVISSVIGGIVAIAFIQLPLLLFAISSLLASVLLINSPKALKSIEK